MPRAVWVAGLTAALAARASPSAAALRRRGCALAILMIAAGLAGCVSPPSQRYVVHVLGGEGATVEVPVPVEADGSIPKFVQKIEFVEGRGTFAFVDTEHGPALRVEPAGDDVALSAREFGGLDLRLTMLENGTLWGRATESGVKATVVVGHTEPPECPETFAEFAWDAAGWAAADRTEGSRCG